MVCQCPLRRGVLAHFASNRSQRKEEEHLRETQSARVREKGVLQVLKSPFPTSPNPAPESLDSFLSFRVLVEAKILLASANSAHTRSQAERQMLSLRSVSRESVHRSLTNVSPLV